jgi:hypothetical protein
MIFDQPKHAAADLASKLAIRMYKLKELLKQDQSAEILERIKLKEELLNELREYLARKNSEVK